jgi:hypothetical protein
MSFNKCCKPFPDEKCSKNVVELKRTFLPYLPNSINKDRKLYICTTCHFKLSKNKYKKDQVSIDSVHSTPHDALTQLPANITPISTTSTSSPGTSSEGELDQEVSKVIALENINKLLPTLGKSPIYHSRMKERHHHEQKKIIDLTAVLPSTSTSSSFGIEPLLVSTQQMKRKAQLFDEFMDQLKAKFNQVDKKYLKIQLLTTVPKSMSISEIQNEFGTTQHMVRTAKDLQSKYGAISLPEPRIGKQIPNDLKQSVINYYNDDEVSRILPGKNDCVTVRIEQQKMKVQKRLMMCTLKECFEGYKERYKNDESKKIGFSKFATLRPKNCVQPGSSGTHTVCVCTYHQNIKLFLHGANIEAVTDKKICDYKDCISSVLCQNPSYKCHLLKCKQCPGLEHFKQYLITCFLEH